MLRGVGDRTVRRENKRDAPIGEGRTAEVFHWAEGQVVKLFKPEFVQRAVPEAERASAAHAAGARTPRVLGLAEHQGRTGIVFEYVQGHSLMSVLSAKPWRVRQEARELARLHASIHRCFAPDLPELVESFRPLIQSAQGLSERQRKAALDSLDALPDGDKLCHGDMHPGNVIQSSGELIAIDWATAARGHPLLDLGITAMIMQLAQLPPGTPWLLRSVVPFVRNIMRTAYLSSYEALLTPADDLRHWQLPLAAARLGRGIDAERLALLRLVEAELRR
jgi:uncharacterized protein (TIGR02172 family)